jgi:hypothetical protein
MSKRMAPPHDKKKEERPSSESEEELDEYEVKDEECKEDEGEVSRIGDAGAKTDPFAVDFSQVQDMRREQKVQFRELGQTKEYAET